MARRKCLISGSTPNHSHGENRSIYGLSGDRFFTISQTDQSKDRVGRGGNYEWQIKSFSDLFVYPRFGNTRNWGGESYQPCKEAPARYWYDTYLPCIWYLYPNSNFDDKGEPLQYKLETQLVILPGFDFDTYPLSSPNRNSAHFWYSDFSTTYACYVVSLVMLRNSGLIQFNSQ